VESNDSADTVDRGTMEALVGRMVRGIARARFAEVRPIAQTGE